jgi:putative serine protease PepD
MTTVTDPTTTTTIHENPAGPVRRRLVTLLTVLALFGSGVGIGYLFTDTQEPAAPTTTVAEIEVTAEPTEPQSPTPTLVAPDSGEPVADVAEALLPSIVQIDTGGGVGSGVIYDSAGLIMTAAHVVESAAVVDGVATVDVRLFDGRVVTGTVVGADAVTDIAVIQIEESGLTAAPLALDEKPRVGQLAIALGSPWGLDSTVTSGIVSAVDRTLTDFAGENSRSMLQTDAAINPGNSGGPLADREGRVIGINVSIFTESGASDGVGFAVPIDRAYRVAEALRSGEEFVPGFLGVRGENAAAGSPAGAVMVEITPGSAAEAAGLEVGDLVTAVDAIPVTGIIDLAARIRDRQAGDVVVLSVIRDGETLDLTATLRASEG